MWFVLCPEIQCGGIKLCVFCRLYSTKRFNQNTQLKNEIFKVLLSNKENYYMISQCIFLFLNYKTLSKHVFMIGFCWKT